MSKPRNIIPAASRAHVNWLNYGDPGVGKSQLIGTAGKGTLVLANNMDETVPMKGTGVEVWHVPDYHELTDAVEYVMHEGHQEYKMVWLDNGTLMQEQGMSQIMDDAVAAKPHLNRFIPDRPQYLINQNRLAHLIRILVQAPIHFGMTAHCMVGNEVQQDDDGDIVEEEYLIPAFQGTRGLYSQKICGFMNLVTHMGVTKRKGKRVRVLTTTQTGRVLAKDRFGVLPGRIINPSIPAIMDRIGTAGQPPRKAKSSKKAAKRRTTKKR